MSNIKDISLWYGKILDYKWTVKVINLGTVALFCDYLIGLFRLAWPSITANIYNPLLWKMEANGEHHVLDIIFLIWLYGVLAIGLYKLDIRLWGLFALYFWYFNISIHEIAWWIAYLITHLYFTVAWVTHTGLWMGDTVVIISFFIFYKITKSKVLQNNPEAHIGFRIPYVYFIFIIIIYGIWIMIGFPVTVAYTGWTVYYFSTSVNALEIFVWIFSIIVFVKTFQVYKPRSVNKIIPKGES